jgi:hypothetical protein
MALILPVLPPLDQILTLFRILGTELELMSLAVPCMPPYPDGPSFLGAS